MATRWTDRELSLLGTNTDRFIAAQIGRTRAAVLMKRSGLEIAPFRLDCAKRLSEQDIATLGSDFDGRLAAQAGVQRVTIRLARIRHGIAARPKDGQWSQGWLSQLGRISDSELARAMGITRQAVRSKRLALKIELA